MNKHFKQKHCYNNPTLQFSQFFLLAALVAVASARPDRPPPSYAPQYAPTNPEYAYSYAVVDDYAGVNYNANEERSGYNTNGGWEVRC